MNGSGKTDLCLWCDGRSVEGEESGGNSKKRKRDTSPPPSKCALKEKQIDDIAAELMADKLDFSDPQYRLWARMIVTGNHSSKETPPRVPLITGITPHEDQ